LGCAPSETIAYSVIKRRIADRFLHSIPFYGMLHVAKHLMEMYIDTAHAVLFSFTAEFLSHFPHTLQRGTELSWKTNLTGIEPVVVPRLGLVSNQGGPSSPL
jgi:hypothetical protein